MSEKYETLSRLGLCHRCEKRKAIKNRKFCAECLEKFAQYNAEHYDSDKAKEYQKRRRELYLQKKQNGICVRCSETATHGIYCYHHSIYAKRHSILTAERRKRERHERGLIPEIRINNNLCLRCGNPIDIPNSKLCKKCTEQNRQNSSLADKSKWRSAEKARFDKNERWRKKNAEL